MGMISYVPDSSETVETTSPVWRVAWNVTGTVLATSSEDGTLSFWRRNIGEEGARKWINIQNLPHVRAAKQFYQMS